MLSRLLTERRDNREEGKKHKGLFWCKLTIKLHMYLNSQESTNENAARGANDVIRSATSASYSLARL